MRRIFETRRQSAADRIALTVGEFGLQNTRGAGADEHADAPPAPARGRRLHGFEEAVLLQGKFGQTVVAAIEFLQIRRQTPCVDARDLADVGIDVDGLEIAALEAAALLEQGGQRRRRAACQMQLVAVNSASSSGVIAVIPSMPSAA